MDSENDFITFRTQFLLLLDKLSRSIEAVFGGAFTFRLNCSDRQAVGGFIFGGVSMWKGLYISRWEGL